jgi:arylsulfate sulfotransferase
MTKLACSIEFRRRLGRLVWAGIAALSLAQLTGCGGADQATLAQRSQVALARPVAGITPFINFVDVLGDSIAQARSVTFTIRAKPGHLSKAVKVTQGMDYLVRRGYAILGQPKLTLPIFGLYAGYRNMVTIDIEYVDGSHALVDTSIDTADYVLKSA